LKLPRIRFLLADDPGAGKTIMAGLLLKELKVRGLVKRTLIVALANLTFQWQRELKDKFREQFDVMRGEVLRTQYGQNPGKSATRSSRRSRGSRVSRTRRRVFCARSGTSSSWMRHTR
jgi:SNF2 family DNA or RNA helicase